MRPYEYHNAIKQIESILKPYKLSAIVILVDHDAKDIGAHYYNIHTLERRSLLERVLADTKLAPKEQ